MRSKGTAVELEARRRLAIQRVEEGWSQKEVAAFLGVHRVTVAKWAARKRADGDGGLAARPTPGRPAYLTAEQEKEALSWLADPPTKHGFRTDLWTARRLAELTREKFGVSFHPHYLREWLRGRGYTPQKPARRPRQRKPEAVAAWQKDDWPRIEKKSRRSVPTSS